MAKNLRAKIDESDSLIVFDVNAEACEKLKKEVGNVDIAKDVQEVGEKAVCQKVFIYTVGPRTFSNDDHIIVLSMI